MLPDTQYGDLFTLSRITMTFIGIASPNLSCERQYVWNEARSEWGIMSWAIRTQETLLNSSSKLQYMLTKMESGNTASRWELHNTRWLQHADWSGQLCQRIANGFCRFKLLIPADLISKSFKVMGISNALHTTEDNYIEKKKTFKIWVGVLHMREQYISKCSHITDHDCEGF
jgi:hypothetical protein